jgi:Protein of unknown function (DUF1592)/Protein of unknown function (DUF1588)/Protein of unknown function (DUF1595)/Protein of unknown function (DUF1587)
VTPRLMLRGTLTLALAAVSCSGKIGSSGASGSSASGTGGSSGATGSTSSGAAGTSTVATGAAGAGAPTTPPAAVCANGQSGKPAYQMLRRLSEAEYNNTLIDVFGADAKAWQTIQFVGDLRQAGAYATLSSALTVNQPWMASLVDATFDRAQALLTGPQASTLLVAPCSATVMDATCATAMVRAYGYRLFRRPVTDAEVADYVSLYTQGVTTLQMTPSDALAGTLAAVMQSPNALYIQELGQAQTGANGGFKLSGYELASILAYGLTGTAPTKALLDGAGTGALDSPTGIAAATQAMIASPAGQAHMSQFFLQWLSYDGAPYAAKDPAVYTLPNTVATAMVTETQLTVDHAYQGGGSLADLLTSSSTYVNLSLAKFYGWSTTGLTDTQFTTQARPAGQGVGLLAQGGFLARMGTPNSSSPTQRGLFVLRQLICKDVPPPPANVPVIPVPTANVTTRQRYETQHAVGSCGACHTHIDDIGFGLENFDGVGVYRTKDAGQTVDASGYIEDLNHMVFTGPEDLARKLAAAPEVAQCLAAQMTAYVLGVSVTDGLCIAPAAAYAQGATPLAMSDVLTKVVEPTHLQTRAAP